MDKAYNAADRIPITYGNPTLNSPPLDSHNSHTEHIPETAQYNQHTVRAVEPLQHFDEQSSAQFSATSGEPEYLKNLDAIFSQFSRVIEILGPLPLTRRAVLSTQLDKVLEMLEPLTSIELLAVQFSKKLEQLEPEEIPHALQLSFNEMNCQIPDPRYHAVFKSPPKPLEEWKELFNRLVNDPEVNKVKKVKKGIIRTNNEFSEKVLEQMRLVLTGAKYDQLRQSHKKIKEDNPLIRIIEATKMAGDIAPETLVNALNRAGQSKYIRNFSDLLDGPALPSESDSHIHLGNRFRRSDLTRHSWSSRESGRLSRSSSIRGSNTSIDTMGTNVTHERYSLTSTHHKTGRSTENDSPKSQRSLYDHMLPAQTGPSMRPALPASFAQVGLDCSQASYHSDGDAVGIATVTQPELTKEYDDWRAVTGKRNQQVLPPTSTPSMTISVPSRYHRDRVTDDPTLCHKPSEPSSLTARTNIPSTFGSRASTVAKRYTQAPQEKSSFRGLPGNHYKTRPALEYMPPLPNELMAPLSPEDQRATVMSELSRVLSKTTETSSAMMPMRTTTASSGYGESIKVATITPRDSTYLFATPQPERGIASTSFSTFKPSPQSLRIAPASTLASPGHQKQVSFHHPGETINSEQRQVDERYPPPQSSSTETLYQTQKTAGKSSKESLSPSTLGEQSGSQYWTDSLSQPENSTVKRGDSLPSEFKLYRLEDSPPLGMVKKASPHSPGMESKSKTVFSQKSNIGNGDHPTQTRYRSYKEK
ncbi:hypothetical protein [Endozoicomonas elysicola]|uniref:Uncharacterized protein n=1 Tax=Endozoicomonas elysicola TaxID=305900 RepID=A0A081KF34_9GAMM|nr:hypothetical protein [Endozoicomonas elysicola]KEI72760.1 hypothetical protein GV64_20320 [Endozoicomonas elysicola]